MIIFMTCLMSLSEVLPMKKKMMDLKVPVKGPTTLFEFTFDMYEERDDEYN